MTIYNVQYLVDKKWVFFRIKSEDMEDMEDIFRWAKDNVQEKGIAISLAPEDASHDRF